MYNIIYHSHSNARKRKFQHTNNISKYLTQFLIIFKPDLFWNSSHEILINTFSMGKMIWEIKFPGGWYCACIIALNSQHSIKLCGLLILQRLKILESVPNNGKKNTSHKTSLILFKTSFKKYIFYCTKTGDNLCLYVTEPSEYHHIFLINFFFFSQLQLFFMTLTFFCNLTFFSRLQTFFTTLTFSQTPLWATWVGTGVIISPSYMLLIHILNLCFQSSVVCYKTVNTNFTL